MNHHIEGLVAATHTPFRADGGLEPAAVEGQAAHLHAQGIRTVFVGGSTGECHSLAVEERLLLAARWAEVVRGTGMRLVVHVGSNCLADSRRLATQAAGLGAVAISALAPSYFKPATVDTLVACCASVAGAAPETPFYYYDIPALTGVSLPMPRFLELAGDRIPSLVGIKFTNVDFASYQICREAAGGRFDILWGVDEMLVAALATGAAGAVGSTYNFAASISHAIIDAFRRGDLETARREQRRSVALVHTLAKRGYLASAKALMGMRGVDVGPPRLPNTGLTAGEIEALRGELESLDIAGIPA